jgi:MFS family permease
MGRDKTPSFTIACIAVACLFLLGAGFAQQLPVGCPTALSRLDLLHSLLHKRLNIDAQHTNTPDKAQYKGHFYSDKAPGTVVLALPAFAAAVISLRVAGVPLDSDAGWLVSSWVACLGSIGIIAALGAGLMVAWLSQWVGLRHSIVTTLGLFLGAAPLPYSTMMFSHALVVGLLCIAICAVARQASAQFEHRGGGTGHWLKARRWVLLAGFASGWALASEYTAGVVLGGLLVSLASQGWRRAVPFCLAAVPPLLLIPLYSWACFGSPFILPYSLNASFPEMKEGLYAIKWPDPETAFHLLFGPARGLLFWTPFLAIAIVGYRRLAASNLPLFCLTYAVPLLQIIVISGRTWDWPAGPTLGPRYLAPILPLLALPCALGVQRFPRLGIALAGYSILITTLATLTNASPPFPGHPNPLFDLHIPMLLKGQLAPNLGTVCGLPPWLSVVVYYAILCGGIWWLWHRLPPESAEGTPPADPPLSVGVNAKSTCSC